MEKNIFEEQEGEFDKSLYTTQADTLQPFSSDTALAILFALDKYGDVVCVREITTLVNMKQPTISWYLHFWLRLGILHGKKVGTYTFYSLNRARLREILQPLWDLCQRDE